MSIESYLTLVTGKVKRTIANAVFTLAAATGALEQKADAQTENIQSANRENLYVNTADTHYTIEKNRSAGEQDMYKLADTEKLEEGWLFIRYKNGRSVWKEVGKDQTEERMNIEFGKKELGNPQNISELTIYHFHPYDHGKRDFTKSQTPSILDMKSFDYILSYLAENFPDLVKKTDYKIIVSTGIYQITCDTRNFDSEQARKKANSVLENLEEQRLKSITGNGDFNYAAWNNKNFASENKRFAKTFSTGLFPMTFTQKSEYAQEIPLAKAAQNDNVSTRNGQQVISDLETKVNALKEQLNDSKRKLENIKKGQAQ